MLRQKRFCCTKAALFKNGRKKSSQTTKKLKKNLLSLVLSWKPQASLFGDDENDEDSARDMTRGNSRSGRKPGGGAIDKGGVEDKAFDEEDWEKSKAEVPFL